MSFLDSVKSWAVGLVKKADRPLVEPAAASKLHPLDDRDMWRHFPAYDPPSDVDIATSQKWIDDLMGRTRGESIYKLVWNGDTRYWNEFYTQWENPVDGIAKGKGQPDRWPIVRFGTMRNPVTGRPTRQLFPPRWLIFSRLEPEQYADHYRQESYSFDDSIKAHKQIRPDTPPSVFWLHWHTIGHHNEYCCRVLASENKKCFGMYAPPEAARQVLETQRDADAAAGQRSVYQKVDRSFIGDVENETNSYRKELEELKADAAYYTENPMSLFGLDTNISPAEAKQKVKEYFDKQIQEAAKLV